MPSPKDLQNLAAGAKILEELFDKYVKAVPYLALEGQAWKDYEEKGDKDIVAVKKKFDQARLVNKNFTLQIDQAPPPLSPPQTPSGGGGGGAQASAADDWVGYFKNILPHLSPQIISVIKTLCENDLKKELKRAKEGRQSGEETGSTQGCGGGWSRSVGDSQSGVMRSGRGEEGRAQSSHESHEEEENRVLKKINVNIDI
jgi:hypothetical protein